MSRKPKSQLMQGTVQVLVLKILSGGPLHGYAVARKLEALTDGILSIEDAALYQGLHRMEAQELIEASWGKTDTGRKAKFYHLTEEGERRLASESQGWFLYADAVRGVLEN